MSKCPVCSCPLCCHGLERIVTEHENLLNVYEAFGKAMREKDDELATVRADLAAQRTMAEDRSDRDQLRDALGRAAKKIVALTKLVKESYYEGYDDRRCLPDVPRQAQWECSVSNSELDDITKPKEAKDAR